MEDKKQKHLWEYEHPYYCNEGNFFKNDYHEIFHSWDSYIDGWKDYDIDMNLIWRWDATLNEDKKFFKLQIFRILQRKGFNRSEEITYIPVELEDHVKEFLKPHWERMKQNWEGISND